MDTTRTRAGGLIQVLLERERHVVLLREPHVHADGLLVAHEVAVRVDRARVAALVELERHGVVAHARDAKVAAVGRVGEAHLGDARGDRVARDPVRLEAAQPLGGPAVVGERVKVQLPRERIEVRLRGVKLGRAVFHVDLPVVLVDDGEDRTKLLAPPGLGGLALLDRFRLAKDAVVAFAEVVAEREEPLHVRTATVQPQRARVVLVRRLVRRERLAALVLEVEAFEQPDAVEIGVKHLARLDDHLTEMLVAVQVGRGTRAAGEHEDVHGPSADAKVGG